LPGFYILKYYAVINQAATHIVWGIPVWIIPDFKRFLPQSPLFLQVPVMARMAAAGALLIPGQMNG
jgi:hypothetical protein